MKALWISLPARASGLLTVWGVHRSCPLILFILYNYYCVLLPSLPHSLTHFLPFLVGGVEGGRKHELIEK